MTQDQLEQGKVLEKHLDRAANECNELEYMLETIEKVKQQPYYEERGGNIEVSVPVNTGSYGCRINTDKFARFIKAQQKIAENKLMELKTDFKNL